MVTGAARGVGEALVRRLSAEGMRIALLGREQETLSQVAASLAVTTVCIEADVTDQAALDRAARQVDYERRTREGKTRREIIRCLKRYAAPGLQPGQNGIQRFPVTGAVRET